MYIVGSDNSGPTTKQQQTDTIVISKTDRDDWLQIYIVSICRPCFWTTTICKLRVIITSIILISLK